MEIASYPVSLRCLKARGVTRLFNGQNENLASMKRLVLFSKHWKKFRVNVNRRMNALYCGGQSYKREATEKGNKSQAAQFNITASRKHLPQNSTACCGT